MEEWGQRGIFAVKFIRDNKEQYKDMAKVEGTLAATLGKVGPVRYYQRNGKVYSRAAHNSRSGMQHSTAQIASRLRHTSVTVLWKLLKDVCVDLFGESREGGSPYSAFLSANSGRGVYLTKEEKDNCQVIVPLQISKGTLPPIEQWMEGGELVTELELNGLQLSGDTTIGTLSQALVCANQRLGYGDDLMLVCISQEEKPYGPVCRTTTHTLTLDATDERKLYGVLPETFFSQQGNLFSTSGSIPKGCLGFIHVKRHPGHLPEVSTQDLVNNNTEMIERYLSDEQFEKAKESYLPKSAKLESFSQPSTEKRAEGIWKIEAKVTEGQENCGKVEGGGYCKDGHTIVLTAKSKAGYRFDRWNDGDTSPRKKLTAKKDITFTASFTPE